jgi:hypothetical protein
LKIVNPWPNEVVEVVSADSGKEVASMANKVLEFETAARGVYILQRHEQHGTYLEPVSGTPANSAKRFGRVQIGLFRDDK